jgi:hypothetical protein
VPPDWKAKETKNRNKDISNERRIWKMRGGGNERVDRRESRNKRCRRK